jgi:hypothetical protein
VRRRAIDLKTAAPNSDRGTGTMDMVRYRRGSTAMKPQGKL